MQMIWITVSPRWSMFPQVEVACIEITWFGLSSIHILRITNTEHMGFVHYVCQTFSNMWREEKMSSSNAWTAQFQLRTEGAWWIRSISWFIPITNDNQLAETNRLYNLIVLIRLNWFRPWKIVQLFRVRNVWRKNSFPLNRNAVQCLA